MGGFGIVNEYINIKVQLFSDKIIRIICIFMISLEALIVLHFTVHAHT